MIIVNTTAGAEVEGIKIDTPLINELMGSLTDKERAERVGTLLINVMVVAMHFQQNFSFEDAVQFVADNTERIT